MIRFGYMIQLFALKRFPGKNESCNFTFNKLFS